MLVVDFHCLLQNVQSFFVREHMLKRNGFAVQSLQRGLVNSHSFVKACNRVFVQAAHT